MLWHGLTRRTWMGMCAQLQQVQWSLGGDAPSFPGDEFLTRLNLPLHCRPSALPLPLIPLQTAH